MRYILLLAIGLSLLTGGSPAAFEFITGRGAGLGKSVVLSQSTASVLVSVPGAGIADRELKLELGVNRRFEIKDLDQAFAAAAYRRHRFTYTLGLSQFGYRDLYAERTAKAGVAWHIDSLTIGANISAMLVYFGGGYDRLSSVTFGGGLSYRTRRFIGALTVDNVNSPRLTVGSPALKPVYTAYVEVFGEGAHSLVGRITLEATQRPQFALGQKIDLSIRGALYWGLSTAPFQYGGGVEIRFRKSRFLYAVAYHPVLGFTHTGTLTFDFPRSRKSTGGQP
jgi:hypothetical protein